MFRAFSALVILSTLTLSACVDEPGLDLGSAEEDLTTTQLFPPTSLAKGASKTGSYTAIETGTLTFKTAGTGDADLYVKRGAGASTTSFNCKSTSSTAVEQCALDVTAGDSISYSVFAFTATTVSLGVTSQTTTTTVLVPSGPIAEGASKTGVFTAPAAGELVFRSAGTGDVDLYIKRGTVVTTTSNDCRSEGVTAVETCRITVAAGEQVAWLLYGYSASTASLSVTAPAAPIALVTSTTSLTVAEAGSPGQFMVHLSAKPSSATTVTITSSNNAVVAVSPTTLTFDATNWSADQPVTVTGIQDPNVANESAVLTLSAATLPNVQVTVNVLDDDTLSIIHDAPAAIQLVEGGTAVVHVKLSAMPAANVVINATSGDLGAATVTPASLTFTTANWNQDQTVVVTGAQDLDVVDESVMLTLSSAGLPSVGITAFVHDDDVLAIVTDMSSITLGEAGTTTFHVSLSAQPPTNVMVQVTSSDLGAATAGVTQLTFTSANWAQPQSVAVTGVDDADLTNEQVTITLASPPMQIRTVTANILDDDL